MDEFYMTAFLRLLAASACGALLGLEREMKGRPAGLKTFSLVCVGSSMAMITNEYIYLYIAKAAGDVSRMAAQVISGIGFLGAGTIMVTGSNQIRGLTTAASLWVTASIGIAIGSGFCLGGVMGVAVVYVSSFIYRFVDAGIMKFSRIMKLYLEGEDDECLERLMNYLDKNQVRVLDIQRHDGRKWFPGDVAVMVELDFGHKIRHDKMLSEIKDIKGIRCADEF